MIEDGLFVDEHSHKPYRSTLNESGINIYSNPTAIDPFFTLVCHLTMCRMSVGRKKCHVHGKRKE